MEKGNRLARRDDMEKGSRKQMGAALGTVGLLVLALNLVDYYAGWNRLAHETTIIGLALALAGAYLVLTQKKEEGGLDGEERIQGAH
jgi:hypothetical protein